MPLKSCLVVFFLCAAAVKSTLTSEDDTLNLVKQWNDTENDLEIPESEEDESNFEDNEIESIAIKSLRASSSSFNYDMEDENGPLNWGKFSKVCETGQRQTPIALEVREATEKRFESHLRFEGLSQRPKSIKVENNGHSAKVKFDFGGFETPRMSGGPLNKTYIFDSFHYHWGRTQKSGTEHQLNGHKYAAELHIVTYNSEYQTLSAAAQKSDGLSVLGFLMYEETRHTKRTALPFLNSLESIIEPGTSTEITNTEDLFSLRDLVKTVSGRYLTYEGSLTTPNCNEAVTWIVFTRLLRIFPRDLTKLRQLKDDDGLQLIKNWRPLQDINGRTVYTNV